MRSAPVHRYLADPRLSPTRIADALHISRRTLYAAVPHDEGVAAEIRRQRLERARAMLRDSSQTRSIAEIAAAVGLPNAAHLSRLFRASPAERWAWAEQHALPVTDDDAHRSLGQPVGRRRATRCSRSSLASTAESPRATNRILNDGELGV